MHRNPLIVTNPEQSTTFDTTAEEFEQHPPKTVIALFKETLTKFGGEPALRFKASGDEAYQTLSYTAYWNECVRFAKTLLRLGIPKFGVVNIIGFNSCEWFIATLGSILAGCIPAGMYTTNSAETCRFISEHSNAHIIIVNGKKQLAKYAEIIGHLPNVKAVVIWGETASTEHFDTIITHLPNGCYSWDIFLAIGHEISDSAVQTRQHEVEAGHCATLIYTSGTTGPPKAVMISHDNITWTAENICSNYMQLDHTDRVVSYLPLSHIAAQLIDIYCMLHLGGCVFFAQPDAMKGSLATTLRDVKPTFFFAVPRVWEKMMEKMKQMQSSASYFQRNITTWAMNIGKEKSENFQIGGNKHLPFGFRMAEYLVFKQVKRALGLNKCKGCFTAAAPIAPETLWFFAGFDIPVYELFGQSECTGPHTVSSASHWLIGSVGRPIRGTETKIEPTSGEVCYRGRHIFLGYMNRPEDTQKDFDADGYFHSGDIGQVDATTGMITITGRIKDLIITAGGENISPTHLESVIKQEIPAISNVFVIGDRCKYLTMLVSLQCDTKARGDVNGVPYSDQLAAEAFETAEKIHSKAMSYSAAKEDEKWSEYINQGLAKVNAKAPSNAQKIQKWRWLTHDFSEQGGELTATLKVKRNKVVEEYAELIESMYCDEDEVAAKAGAVTQDKDKQEEELK